MRRYIYLSDVPNGVYWKVDFLWEGRYLSDLGDYLGILYR